MQIKPYSLQFVMEAAEVTVAEILSHLWGKCRNIMELKGRSDREILQGSKDKQGIYISIHLAISL